MKLRRQKVPERLQSVLVATVIAAATYLAALCLRKTGEEDMLAAMATIVLVVFGILLCVWMYQVFRGVNADGLALLLVLTHAFVHYLPLRETWVDGTWHCAQAVLGSHALWARKKYPRAATAWCAVHLLHCVTQMKMAVNVHPDEWGAYMMSPSLVLPTWILTLDGIAGPMIASAVFVLGESAHRDAILKELWLISAVVATLYLLIVDGWLFAQASLYGVWQEFIEIAAAALYTVARSPNGDGKSATV